MSVLSSIGNGLLAVHNAIARILNPFQIRGIVIKVILPWNEGFFVYPIDYGYDSFSNTSFITWLCLHIRLIGKNPPFPAPPVAKAPVAPAPVAAPVVVPTDAASK